MGNGWDRPKSILKPPPVVMVDSGPADRLSEAVERFLDDGTTSNYNHLKKRWAEYESERKNR